MILSSSKYYHKKEHKITWISPDQKTFAQIDHVLVMKRKQSNIKDLRTYRGACADSVHFIIIATIRQGARKCSKVEHRKTKYDEYKRKI